jgi:hypothetical protein
MGELPLLARMIFPLVSQAASVHPMLRNDIFNNIIALHKEYEASSGPDLPVWDLFVVVALAARMPAMTNVQGNRLLHIVDNLLQRELLPQAEGS